MAASDCVEEILAAARSADPDARLEDDELNALLGDLDAVRQARQVDQGLNSLEDDLLDAATDYARSVTEAAQIEARNRLINLRVKSEFRQFMDQVTQATGDPSLAFEARMVGINNPVSGGRSSADARSLAIFTEYAGGLVADLRRDSLLPLFNSRSLEREVAKELAELAKPDGVPGISNSPQALEIARIMDKYRRVSVARENRAGAWIKPLSGYIVRQSHDMARMQRAGYDEWRDTIFPLLDPVTTFRGKDPETVLRGVYDGLVTGNHIRANGGQENALQFAFKGPANLARKASSDRVLHFRDADAWMDYNDAFGTRSMTEAFIGDLERAAKNTALMETFGTNPRAMFDTLLDEAKDTHRGDVKVYKRLNRRALQSQFAEIDGTANIPGNPTAAQVSSGIRAVQSMAKLGGAFISSISDIGFGVGERRYQGKNLLSAWGQTLGGVAEGFSGSAKREVGDLIGVGLDGTIGDIGARFSSQDHLVGKMAKAQRLFYKLNLLGPWTDANKRGLGLMMARDLAMQSNKSFGQMPEATSRLLAQYGMDEGRWEIARKAVRKADDGREYLFPDALDELDNKLFGSTDRDANRLRDDIKTALRAYYVDRADFASPTPGAKERAILRQGTQPGTAAGEAIRFVAQFKAFPITVLTKPMSRDLFGAGASSFQEALLKGKGDVLGVAHLFISTTILGYLAMSAKDLAKGRTPRDPFSPKTWLAAALQGGGLGLYGDFLFGEYSRFGNSLTESLAGPTFSTVSDLAALAAGIRNGEESAARTIRLVQSNTPYANLFYTKAALDYLIFYEMQEAINPGYLRRMEKRIQRENSQTFILPPSRVVK